MARHGENIRKRKDGRWEGRYPVFCEKRGKKKYQSVYGKTYEAVKEKLTEKKIWLRQQENREKELESQKIYEKKGLAVPKKATEAEKMRLEEFWFTKMAEEWLEEVKAKKKWSTYIKYRMVYQKHLKTPFQEIRLTALPEALAGENEFASLSDSIRKSIYCVLSQVLKFVSRQYQVTLPVLKRPDFHARKKPVEVFSKKEQAKLFSVLYQEMDRYKMAVLLCLHTGLRLGELCALKWSDIDQENLLLMVNRTVQRISVEGHSSKTILMETAPKSEHSRREIPLPPAIFERLLQWKEDKAYIFGGDRSLEPRTLQNHFKQMLTAAGVENKNFHVLRHTFSTNCIEGGTDVKSLSEILGHSDVQITLNRYVHPSMETKRRYLNDLSRFYGQIYGQAG